MKNLRIFGSGTRYSGPARLLLLACVLFAYVLTACPAAAEEADKSAPTAIESVPMDAQDEAMPEQPADVNATGAKPKARGMDKMSIIILIAMVFFLFMMFRGPRKKQQEHRKMVQSLQKNDRVRTIGGIYGTIVDVRDDEIVLKIDESSNTKIKVSPSAIGTKVADETK